MSCDGIAMLEEASATFTRWCFHGVSGITMTQKKSDDSYSARYVMRENNFIIYNKILLATLQARMRGRDAALKLIFQQ